MGEGRHICSRTRRGCSCLRHHLLSYTVIVACVLLTSRKEVLGCLINELRDYFAKAARLESPEQRKVLKDHMVQQMRKQQQQQGGAPQETEVFYFELIS